MFIKAPMTSYEYNTWFCDEDRVGWIYGGGLFFNSYCQDTRCLFRHMGMRSMRGQERRKMNQIARKNNYVTQIQCQDRV